jgi:TRAP-type mannitol/chloroaromatic compound transport system substrate-binding protein
VKDNNLNIQEKLQEFHRNSLIIKDYSPKILARLDSNNLEVYIEKIAKTTGEVYKSDSGFFGTLKYSLRRLLKEVLNVETLKDNSIFDKYKDVKVKDSVKEIYEEVIADFNVEVLKQKKLLKGK